MPDPSADQIEVVAPNLKRRLSGVTATVVRLIPVQARMIGITTTGPGLPPELPHIPLTRAAKLPRDRWRVWHARRNTEMALGLILRRVLRRRYRLLFTSAAQRRHTGRANNLRKSRFCFALPAFGAGLGGRRIAISCHLFPRTFDG